VNFESEYVNLLIKQYWEKPKAYAEIGMKAGAWRKTFEWIDSFSEEFDLDSATGDRLDIIGRNCRNKTNRSFCSAENRFGLTRIQTHAGLMISFRR